MMLRKLFSNHYDSQLRPSVKLQVDYPPVNELLAKAEKLTNSCVHPDQVAVSRNFVLNVARRAVEHRKYTLEDLNTVGLLVDHMAASRARSIYSLNADQILVH